MLSFNISDLNKEQLQAVVHPPDIPLQILAGPGSGKTKVVTTRIAYLIEHFHLSPSEICAVTFTNKAANEMKERLEKLIGKQKSNQLVMGTFHAICVKFLHKYGTAIGLSNNFTICDIEASKRLIATIIKKYTLDHRFRHIPIKETEITFRISQAKSKGLLPEDLPNQLTDIRQQLIVLVYREYSAVLKQNNTLDFDDLLLFGTRLFSKELKCLNWCRHVLVDEFQDTNFIQYKLMVQLASASAGITIVGDPDQSIYGWRSADVTNLSRMEKDFQHISQILLEENYRSTMPILKFSLALISQDKTRISKNLHSTCSFGTPPILQRFSSEMEEAQFIAREIKRLSANPSGFFGWNDFVILLRFNALSRNIETALQREGIPCRMLAGVKFFDRVEIKDLIAYLQLIDNPAYFPALQRACQTPSKGIGEKSLEQLLSRANATNEAVTNIAEAIALGKIPDIKPPIRKKLMGLIDPLRKLRKMAEKGESVGNIIQELVDTIHYDAHLKRSKDWEARWENVQELINFAKESEKGIVDLDEGVEYERKTPLRKFLHDSMLSTDTEVETSNQTEMVTISTCHSAKGLEWPIVFIPAVEKNIFPFYRSDNEGEERRLLYVACTRAQGFLYLTYSTSRMAGDRVSNGLSPFLAVVDGTLTSSSTPIISNHDCELFAKLLSRPLPDRVQNIHLDQCLSTNHYPLASFGPAKALLQGKTDTSLSTQKRPREVKTSEASSSNQLIVHSSGNVLEEESHPAASRQLPRAGKRLGMGRSTGQGYHLNKKPKLI